MKIALFSTVALVAVVGLALAEGGFYPYLACYGPPAASSCSSGWGAILHLLMLLFLLPLFTSSSNNDQIVLVNSSLTGLSLHGILELLRRHKADTFFVEGTVTSEDVSAIFQPSYSANDEEKATEELIIYNFNKLLKKVERGLVSSQWIDEYTEETGELNIVTIQMRHILRALLSSDSLPRNTCALIEFVHISNRLSSANACAPSLTFSQTKKIQDYATFETHMLYIVVGAPGFGME